MKKIIDWLKNDESGQGTMEYSFILVIISVAFILLLTAFGSAIYDKYISVGAELPK
jgi:pilus assembly protein Flp/PilA